MKRWKTIPIMMILAFSILYSKDFRFNQDSAYSYIKVLSEDIGPRPMGSLKEFEALNWAVKKFNNFGADTAFIMPFSQARSSRRNLNTMSGIAVGIYNGKIDSSIIVGGHIDSEGPEIPGANDNASGASTAIELARLWSQRDKKYTMIFCTFGGEERGLIGSGYFADKYKDLDKVKLMISTDMGGSPSEIVMMFETDSVQAPKWLVQDAFEIAEQQNLNRLTYPTHYSTLNTISKGGSGSDHMSFLNKGIPAIDFTSGMNDSPIHTQQDRLEFIDKAALGEYGNLVDALINHFQKSGIGTQRSARFMLWEVLGIRFYIPGWLITAFIGIAIITAMVAFIYSRKQRMQIEKKDRVRFTGFKLLLMFFVILLFAQLGEILIQTLTGLRYPWYTSISQYLFYALFWAGFGFWVVIQLSRKWIFSPDAYVYSKRFLVILFLYTFLAAILNQRFGLYPALSLLLVSTAVLIKNKYLRSVLIILSPLPLFKLMFNETFQFMGKFMINGGYGLNTFVKSALYSLFLAFLMLIWFIPFVYAYAQIIAENKSVRDIIIQFRSIKTGSVVLLILIGFGIYLGNRPAYNAMWRPGIRVLASFDESIAKSELIITGNEYFKDVAVSGDTSFSMQDTRIIEKDIPILFNADWLQISGNENRIHGEKDTIQFDWTITTRFPSLLTTLELKADSADLAITNSNYLYNKSDEGIRFLWYGDRCDTISVNGKIAIERNVALVRRVKVDYDRLPVNLHVKSALASVRYRTEVVRSDTLAINNQPLNKQVLSFK